MSSKNGIITAYLLIRNDNKFIWHPSCYILLLKKPFTSFAHRIERQASSLSSTMVLPEVKSNNFFFRLSRFPVEGVETILDIYSSGNRLFINVTRFNKSIRKHIIDLKHSEIEANPKIEVEISISEFDRNEPILKDIANNNIFNLLSDLSNDINDNHYFIFFTDSHNCISSGISNPYEKHNEQWIRILNRSYGSELAPPRRNSKSSLISK